MARVLIADKLSPTAARVFEERGVESESQPGLSEDELVQIVGDFDGIVVRSATKVTRRILEGAVQLRVVGRAGSGVDNIDVERATAKGVIVMNGPVRKFGYYRRACDRSDDVAGSTDPGG